MAVQPPPTEEQRCHWYEKAIGCRPVHVPGDAVSVCPVTGVPETVGGSVLAGRAPPPATRTTRVDFEVAAAVPSLFLAWTRTRIVWPMSAPVSR